MGKHVSATDRQAHMKQTRLGIIIFAVAICAAAAVLSARAYNQPAPDEHRRVRQIILYYMLSRVDDPVIVLGDSIVEASTLPRNVCGHPIINAGLNGASTASDLGDWLAASLGEKRPSSIVVALGINDALVPKPISKDVFEQRYALLLTQLSKLTNHLFILAIPPVETRQRMTEEMQKEVIATIGSFNAILPGLARRANATFLPLPEMPPSHTIDGVHLSSGGYGVWNDALIQGVSTICN
jgi:lysophospholipase L1-like esterase